MHSFLIFAMSSFNRHQHVYLPDFFSEGFCRNFEITSTISTQFLRYQLSRCRLEMSLFKLSSIYNTNYDFIQIDLKFVQLLILIER